MSFFEDEQKHEAKLDANGLPSEDMMTSEALPVYVELVEYARAHGCDCDFSLFLVMPFEHFLGMQIIHEQTCIGQMKMKGARGHN